MREDTSRKAIRTSTTISLALSVVLSGSFFLITTLTGAYSIIARYGGAIWVFLLSLIIAMPTITPWVKRRQKT